MIGAKRLSPKEQIKLAKQEHRRELILKDRKLFYETLARYELPLPEPEVLFHPTRQWRFDYAWADFKIALEVEGGIYSNGRHVRGKGYAEDCLKYSEAAVLGWALIRVQPNILRKPKTMDIIRRAFQLRGQLQ